MNNGRNNSFGMFRSSSQATQSDLTGKEGVIDSLASIDIDLDDDELVQNMKHRIEDARDFWNETSDNGFNLSETRKENNAYYNGHQLMSSELTSDQIPYIENQLFIGESAVESYLTARVAQPQVYPSSNKDADRVFASFFEKVISAHNTRYHFGDIATKAVRDAMINHVGVIKLEFDPDEGKGGDIVPVLVDPVNIVIDNNTKWNENPEFIAYTTKMTAKEMVHRWKNKKKAILEMSGITDSETGKTNLDKIMAVTEVWMTYYDKNFEPCEGVAYFCDDLLLEKTKNPNFIYSKPEMNYFSCPKKPFVFMNINSDGRYLVDKTTPFDQARIMQDFLNISGRHSLESSLRSNPTLVIDGGSISEDDMASSDTLSTRNTIVLTDLNPGENATNKYGVVPAANVSPELMTQKQDIRTQVQALIGAPAEFTGTGDADETAPTATQSMMKKDQASGRLDLMRRAIDIFYANYYRMLTQMACVWYKDPHKFMERSDNHYNAMIIQRENIDTGIEIHVEAGSTAPQDRAGQQSLLQQMLMAKIISPYDWMRIAGVEDFEKVYDNWIKFQNNPSDLAREGLDESDDFNARQILDTFILDETEPEPDDSRPEFILALRKVTLTDYFRDQSRKVQKKFNEFINATIRKNLSDQILDNAAKDGVMALNPDLKFTPAQIGAVTQAAGAQGASTDASVEGNPAIASQIGLNPNGTPLSQGGQTQGQPQQSMAPQAQQLQNGMVKIGNNVIDPNHQYSIEELAQLGLSPQDMEAKAQQLQQSGEVQPQQPQGQPPQAPQPQQQ